MDIYPDCLEAHRKYLKEKLCESIRTPARAKKIAEQCQLQGTVDFALLQKEFALLAAYRNSGAANLRLALVDEVTYRRCLEFFERVRAEAVPFGDVRDSGSDLVPA